jgi:hypothetical protein
VGIEKGECIELLYKPLSSRPSSSLSLRSITHLLIPLTLAKLPNLRLEKGGPTWRRVPLKVNTWSPSYSTKSAATGRLVPRRGAIEASSPFGVTTSLWCETNDGPDSRESAEDGSLTKRLLLDVEEASNEENVSEDERLDQTPDPSDVTKPGISSTSMIVGVAIRSGGSMFLPVSTEIEV